jgi:AraC-like DNA-binding protein
MGQVRMSVLAGFDDLVRTMGGNPSILLANFGFATDYLATHGVDDMMSYPAVESLLGTAALVTSTPHFAALLGTKQDYRLLGLVGLLMKHSPDVGAALRQLRETLWLHINNNAAADLEVESKLAFLSYTNTDSKQLSRYTDELAISHGRTILKALCGSDWKPNRIHFQHRSPEIIAPYRQLFEAPVYFSQPKNEIVFDASWLELSISSADPLLYKILMSHIRTLSAAIQHDFCSDVQLLIRRGLPRGVIGIEDIAGQLSMHTRKFQRTLKEQGTSFSLLMETVRKDIATELLVNSDMSIIDLADYLGYADHTAFARAFKRWFNVTPMQWKTTILKHR